MASMRSTAFGARMKAAAALLLVFGVQIAWSIEGVSPVPAFVSPSSLEVPVGGQSVPPPLGGALRELWVRAEDNPFGSADGPGCEQFKNRTSCLDAPRTSPGCHGGLRVCSCAWCGSPASPRCVDYRPCDNAVDFGQPSCAVALEGSKNVDCLAWSNDQFSRKINLVIIATAFWWPFGLLLARALYHRMVSVSFGPILAGWTLGATAVVGPFVVAALVVYHNEPTWNVLLSAFFWWYALFLGVPLALVFVAGIFRNLMRTEIHASFRLVTALVGVEFVWISLILVSQLQRSASKLSGSENLAASTAPSWAIIYKVTLLLIWAQLLYPLERLHVRGKLVPILSLTMLVVVSTSLLMSSLHRGFASEVNWLGVAMWFPALAVTWHNYAYSLTQQVLGYRWKHDSPLPLMALLLWIAGSLICVVLSLPTLSKSAEVSRYLYMPFMHVAILLPLFLPMLEGCCTGRRGRPHSQDLPFPAKQRAHHDDGKNSDEEEEEFHAAGGEGAVIRHEGGTVDYDYGASISTVEAKQRRVRQGARRRVTRAVKKLEDSLERIEEELDANGFTDEDARDFVVVGGGSGQFVSAYDEDHADEAEREPLAGGAGDGDELDDSEELLFDRRDVA